MKNFGAVGFVFLLTGGCTIDSNSIIPAIMVIVGMGILVILSKKEIDH